MTLRFLDEQKIAKSSTNDADRFAYHRSYGVNGDGGVILKTDP